MRIGTHLLEGNLMTRTGVASGNAGKSISIIMGDGNATGPAAGGSLTLKGGAGTTTGAGGSIVIQPGTSASGTAGMVQILPTKATAGGTTALQFMGINSTGYVGFKAPDTVTTNVVWQLPAADGSANQFLQTNGSGVLTWSSVAAVNVFATIAGNSGTAVVDVPSDTLTISGSVGITTVASDTSGNDLLTISMTKTGLTAKTTPTTADQFMLFDAAATDTPSYATLANIISAANIVTATANGMLVRTAANTYTARSITASSSAAQQGIVVSNGDGVSGAPTIGLNINGLTAGTVGTSTTIPAYDGTNNTKITPAQIVSARIVRNTFTNAGLTTGSIAITHNLAVAGVLVQIYDENNQLVQPDNITLTSNNVATVDLSSFGAISGTWSYVIFG